LRLEDVLESKGSAQVVYGDATGRRVSRQDGAGSKSMEHDHD
jgi:hypothetical protein